MALTQYFLAKTDPETYAIDDLERERQTTWDGVTNAQAVLNIRKMHAGDRVLVYHSMGQSAIVGVAEVKSEPRPDRSNPKSWVVDVKFLQRVEPPVTLAEIKATHLFDSWALIRQSRLSTMSAPDEFIAWLRANHAALTKL